MICTTPRSGSTLLCGLLRETALAGNPDSHFHTASLDQWLLDNGLTRSDFPTRDAALSACIEAVKTHGQENTGVFGLRMQRGSFRYFIAQLALLAPQATTHRDLIETIFGATCFIHLTRKDKLDQAISRVIAQQTGLWHRAKDGSELERLAPPRPPHYDGDGIARHLALLTQLDQEWQDWFTQQNIDPLRITYEELAQNPSAQLVRILTALGLNPETATDAKPRVQKLANATNTQWAIRFRTKSSG
ncbi:MAG: Stf0 family sulfotransferase [Paracoccaceae bacterium]